MMQSEIDRAVARATGESRRTIACRGFSLERPSPSTADTVQLGLNCPGCGRLVPFSTRSDERYLSAAECAGCDAVYDVRPDELFVVDDHHSPQTAVL